MEVKLLFQGMNGSAAQRRHGQRVVHFHLSRFGREVTRVELTVAPAAGGHADAGARCGITVGGPNVYASQHCVSAADPMLAMDAAARWAASAVAELLARSREEQADVPHAS